MPRVVWQDFSGGLWLPSDADADARQAEWAIPDDALTEAVNVEYLESGGLRGRRGYEEFDPAALPHPVVGIYRHYPRTGPRESGYSSCRAASTGSGTAWTDQAGAALTDGIETALAGEDEYVECLLSSAGDLSKDLVFANPYVGAAEVANGTISGLVVEIRRRASPAGGIYDQQVQFKVGGSLAGVDRSLREVEWPTDWATIYYGGPGDTWGITGLTAAQINAPDFALVLKVRSELTLQAAQVDYVAIHTYVDLELAATTILVAGDAANVPKYYKPDSDGDGYTLTGAGSLATEYRPRFVPWQELDATFVFDGRNDVRRFDGRNWITGPVNAPKGPYACLWRGRMWATERAEVAFSVYASNVGDVETWNPALQLGVSDPRGGTITGLEAMGERLIILKDSGIWQFQGDIEFGGVLEQISEIGCIAPASVCVLPEGIAFVGEDGVYLLPRNGMVPVELSRPVRPKFRGRTDANVYRDAVAVYLRARRQLWIKLDPAEIEVWVAQSVPDGEGGAKTAWAQYDEAGSAIDFTAGGTLDGEGDTGELLIGQSDGKVRQWDVGAVDNSNAIASRMRTAARQLSADNAQGAVRRVQATARLQADPAALQPVAFSVRYDNAISDAESVTLQIGNAATAELRHPRATFTDLSKFGRFACVALDVDGGPTFELHRIEAEVQMKTRLQWRP